MTAAPPIPAPPARASPSRFPAAWVLAVAAVAVAALVAGVRCGWRHPLPVTWDEAHYYLTLANDHVRWTHVGPRRYVAGLVYDDGRPPAYRLLAAPWVVAKGVDFAPLRAVNVGWFAVAALLSGGIVWRLARSAPAAALTAAATVLAAKAFSSTIHFGTEPALYLSTVLVFAGLFLDWDRPRPRRLGWALLAAGLALAVLAKASVVIMVGLPLVITAGLFWTGRLRGPSPAYLLKAGVAAAAVAGPWWLVNWRRALILAKAGVTFERRTFGPPGPRTWALYLAELVHYEVGLALCLVLIPILAATAWVVVRRTRPAAWPAAALPLPALDLALVTIAVPSLATIGLQMVSTNHDGRLVSHAYLALTLAAGLGVARLGWLRSTAVRWVALLLLAVQAGMLAGPPPAVAAAMARVPLLAVGHAPILRPWPQWDWRPLRAACDARGRPVPSVAVLGQSSCFNVAQVEVPWSRDGLRPRVDQLWQWEQRDFSLAKTLARAAAYDVVVTAPGLVGSAGEHEEWDNQYNVPFADGLAADPAFGPPVRLMLGTPPSPVDVFFNRRGTTRPAASR